MYFVYFNLFGSHFKIIFGHYLKSLLKFIFHKNLNLVLKYFFRTYNLNIELN